MRGHSRPWVREIEGLSGSGRLPPEADPDDFWGLKNTKNDLRMPTIAKI